MGYLIRVARGAVVKVEGRKLTIPVDQIREVQTIQIGDPACKGDNETWVKRFEAEIARRKLTWDVMFSFDSSSANLEGSCMAPTPEGVEVLNAPEFKLIEL